MSLTHNQIWTAIDRLAARAKLTASGLAKKAGLDPTTFNKSKRITPEGRPRWPSTESVAKALQATGTKVDTFVTLITDSGKVAISNVPLIGFAEAGSGGYFDDGGFPVGKGWEEIAFPSVTDEHAYALEISGDSMKPASAKPISGTFEIATLPLSVIRVTKVSTLVPVACSALATDSVDGQRGRPSGVMRLDLLKVVGSRPAFLARPEAVSLARAASRSMAVQIWLCVSDMRAGPSKTLVKI